MIRRYASFFIFVCAVTAALLVAKMYIPRAIIGWDEAHYLTGVYKVTHAIQEGNWKNVVAFSRAQFNPPPMQEWLLAVPLAVVGYSHINARIAGLMFFIIAAMDIYVLGKMTDRKRGEVIGLTASLLFLTAPLMLFFAGIAIKEMLGAAASVITVILYVVAREKMRGYWFAAAGIALTETLLVKFNFGLLLGAGFGLESVYWVITDRRKMSVITNTLIMVVLPVLFLMWWVWTPTDKTAIFLEIIQNTEDYTSQFAPYGSANQLLFYPRAILYGYSVSPWIGYMLLASGIAVLAFWKNLVLRVSWFIFSVNFLLGTVHITTMLERYILTTVPFLYIIGAYCIVSSVDWCLTNRKKLPFVSMCLGALTVVAVITIPDLVKLPEYVSAVGTYTSKSAVFNQRDYRDLWFEYDRSKWFTHIPIAPFEQPKDVVDYILSVADPRKPIQIYGYANELSPWYIELEQALAASAQVPKNYGYASYVAVITIQPSSRLNTRDRAHFNLLHPWNVPPLTVNTSWHAIGSKSFKDLGVDVSVYGI